MNVHTATVKKDAGIDEAIRLMTEKGLKQLAGSELRRQVQRFDQPGITAANRF